eukprot:Gb_01845 [translate_table: standard]
MATNIINSRWSLQGKTALVTGGTRGIGKAIVEELAKLGATVYICSRSQKDIQNVLREWKEEGFSVHGSECDVSSLDACKALVHNVSLTFGGRLDILVNNAGTYINKRTVDLSEEETSFLMSTDFHSAFNLTKLCHPFLKASGRASVVFISSIAGSIIVSVAGSAYSAAKAAMDQTARYLACEWAKDGIRVNSVAPGFIHTELNTEFVTKPNVAKYLKDVIPTGRMGKHVIM